MSLPRWAALALLFACVLLAAVSFARDDNADLQRKVDQLFAHYDKPDAPGCALGIVRDGNFIYKRAYGLASLELGVPLTSQSVFYMGSVSKQFTAASVVLAAGQGYLSLDDDIHEYIPELPSYSNPITIREMLHHTSGLRDIFTLLDLSGRNAEDIHPTPELLDLVSRQKGLNFTPGDQFSYSNTNYFLMSVLIRRTTGKLLSQFAEENIFKPLGMTHTSFYDDHTVVVPGRIPAYLPRSAGGFQMGRSTNFDKIGDGGLMSSVDDMLLWDRNFYDNKLGKGTLLQELQTPGVRNNGQLIDYALGLFISKYQGLPIVAHDGALFGYRTALLRFPQQKFSVICLCNLGSAQPFNLATKIADIYLAGQFVPEAVPTTAANVDPHPYAGRYHSPDSHSMIQLNITDGDLELFGEHYKPRDASHFSSIFGSEMAFDHGQNADTRLTLTFKDGAPRTFETYHPPQPSSEDLAQFVGDYTSSELRATYRLAVKDGKLTSTVNWQQPAALEPILRDEFRDSFGTAFVFHRDDSKGQIAGFDVFVGPVHDIFFARN